MRRPFICHAFIVGVTVIAGVVAVPGSSSVAGAQQAADGNGAGSLPDILGIRTGMPAEQAYAIVKAHDPTHTAVLQQWTIPQLYGNKPITYAMNPANTGPNDQLVVSLTLPPNPQAVWRIDRTLGRFTATAPNVLDSLHRKYGAPWNPNPGLPVNPRVGTLDWFFDEQGRPVNPTAPADVLALKSCMNSTLQFWYGTFDNFPATQQMPPTTVLNNGSPRTRFTPMPPAFDPAKNPGCNNLVWVHAVVNGGTINAGDLSFYMQITINDYTLQHRTYMTLNDSLNAIVNQGAQQQRNNASQQAVPQL